MTPGDLVLRRRTYALFVELGRAPTREETAQALQITPDEVVEGWRRLHDEHALVLNANATAIQMANPFSAVPTAYRVHASGRWWYANCAWDAFGVCAALRVDGLIETSCADCGEHVEVAVQGERPDDEELLFHCLVPAREWWQDIGFT